MNSWDTTYYTDLDYDSEEEEGFALLSFVDPRFDFSASREMNFLNKLRGKHISPNSIHNLGDTASSNQTDPSLPAAPQFKPKYDVDNHLKPDLFVFIISGLLLAFIITSFVIAFLVFGTPWMGAYSIVPLVPGVLLLWLVFIRNRTFLFSIQLARLCKFFALGMVCLIPIFFFESIQLLIINLIEAKARPHITQLTDGAIFSSLLPAFFVVAITEESFKLFIATQIWVKPKRDSVVSILVYTVAFSIGLVTMESSAYLQVSAISSGNAVKTFCLSLIRFLMSLPLHAATGALIGADMSCNKFQVFGHGKPLWRIIVIPYLLRGFFEFFMHFTACLYTQFESPAVLLLGLVALAIEAIACWLAWRKRALLLILQEDFNMYHGKDSYEMANT